MTSLALHIRLAQEHDLPGLIELARHLDSVNLPDDTNALRDILARSKASCAWIKEQRLNGSSKAEPHPQARLCFVLSDDSGKIYGTSGLVIQHGTMASPYIYFEVYEEQFVSRKLNSHFNHRLLRLSFDYNGPTELAALVLPPIYRGKGLGRLLSLSRFLFIRSFSEFSRPHIVAELLPPLESDGTSHLWDALGKRFTGLDYKTADRLSSKDKDFIRELFPSTPLYACLLSDEAQAVIGKVGQATSGVQKLLESEGFRYSHRIDPFDGGPHFSCPLEQVKSYQHCMAVRQLAEHSCSIESDGLLGFSHRTEPEHFRVWQLNSQLTSDGVLKFTSPQSAEFDQVFGRQRTDEESFIYSALSHRNTA